MELRAQVWCTSVVRQMPDHNLVHLQASTQGPENATWSVQLPVLSLNLTVTDDVAGWLRAGTPCVLTLTPVARDVAALLDVA